MQVLRRLTLILTTLALAIGTASAAPALWRVSDDDSHIWLFGSIHILGGAQNWRTPQFDAALEASDVVYYELILDTRTNADLIRLSQAAGANPAGRVLSDYFSPEDYAELLAFLEAYDIDPKLIETMRPWYALITISQLMAPPGTLPAIPIGVETVIQTEVDDAKERALETAAEQIDAISGGSDAEHAAALMDAIRDDQPADEASAVLQRMTQSWLNGDVERIEAELLEGLSSRDSPAYRRLLTDRNQRWVDELTQVLEDNKEAMVIVGAAHLGGPYGLPKLFSQQGFKVERIWPVRASRSQR